MRCPAAAECSAPLRQRGQAYLQDSFHQAVRRSSDLDRPPAVLTPTPPSCTPHLGDLPSTSKVPPSATKAANMQQSPTVLCLLLPSGEIRDIRPFLGIMHNWRQLYDGLGLAESYSAFRENIGLMRQSKCAVPMMLEYVVRLASEDGSPAIPHPDIPHVLLLPVSEGVEALLCPEESLTVFKCGGLPLEKSAWDPNVCPLASCVPLDQRSDLLVLLRDHGQAGVCEVYRRLVCAYKQLSCPCEGVVRRERVHDRGLIIDLMEPQSSSAVDIRKYREPFHPVRPPCTPPAHQDLPPPAQPIPETHGGMEFMRTSADAQIGQLIVGRFTSTESDGMGFNLLDGVDMGFGDVEMADA